MNKRTRPFVNMFLATPVLFGLGLATASLLRRETLAPDFLTKLLVLSAGLVLVYGASLFLDPKKKENMILATLSIGICLLASESALIIANFVRPDEQKVREMAARKRQLPYDNRSKLEVLREFRDKGIQVHPCYIPSLALREGGLALGNASKERLYPLAGISRSPQLMGNENGSQILYQSDEHGFNNPMGLHQAEGLETALIGDSFTQGFCVPRSETIAGLMRSSGLNVINLGMGGNSALLEYATLVEYAAPLKPKNVLWFYYEGNDFRDLPFETADPLLSAYLEGQTQNLRQRQAEINEVLAQFFAQKESEEASQPKSRPMPKLFTPEVLTLPNLRRALGFHNRITPPLADFARIMTAAKAQVNGWGGELTVVYLPEWSRYFLDRAEDDQYQHRGRVLALLNQLGINVIDINDVFSVHPGPLSLFPFRIQGHYNRDGYQLATEHVVQALQQRKQAWMNPFPRE